MPQRRNAIKELRKNRRQHLHNLDIKTDLKKTIKKFLTAAAEKKENSKDLLKEIYKKLDKAAKRHVLHKKTAARRKSHFAKSLASAKQS